MTPFLVFIAIVQAVQIGSGLRDGVQLVYESGGAAQPPWVYDSVRAVRREGFDRCVLVARRGLAALESCTRRDTLFERSGETMRVVRPIGPNMQLEIRSANGNVLQYSTGSSASRRVSGTDVTYLPTTLITRDSAGVVRRRLREDYAPALLTALWGIFEEPEPSGSWRSIREFSLREIR